jgi:toxin ParE1/3/4
VIGCRAQRVVITELSEAIIRAEDFGAGGGRKFLDVVKAQIQLIRDFPEIGPPEKPPFRQRVIPNYPYSLIYVWESWGLEIYAVASHSRRPGYWRSRRKAPKKDRRP